MAATVATLLVVLGAPASASHFRASYGNVTYNSSSHVLTWTIDSGWRKDDVDTFASTPSDIEIRDSSANLVTGAVVTLDAPVPDVSNPLFDVNHETVRINLTNVVGTAGTYTAYVTNCCRVNGVQNTSGNDNFSQQLKFTINGSGGLNVGPAFNSPTLYTLIPVSGSVLDLNYTATDPEGNNPVTYQQITSTADPNYGATALPCTTFTGGHLRLGTSLCASGDSFAALYQAGQFFAVKVRATDSVGNTTDIDTLLRVPVVPDPYVDNITATGSSASVDVQLNDLDTYVDTYTVTCTNSSTPADVVVGSGSSRTVSLTGLNPTAVYNCSASATNGLGTGTQPDTYPLLRLPVVTGLSQTTGSPSGGSNVTITGSGFTGSSSVLFGTTPATSFTVNSATSITAVAPAGSTVTVPVTVTNPVGTSLAVPAGDFSYINSSEPQAPGANPPTAPTSLSVQGQAAAITGRFAVPALPGAGPISRYDISTDGGLSWVTLPTTTTVQGAVQFNVGGLVDGQRYTVLVRAVSGAVTGSASMPVSVLVGAPVTTAVVDRLAGEERVATSVSVSQHVFPGDSRATAAVLATSARFADSIGGARLASAVNGPLLLTDTSSLQLSVAAEIRRLVQAGGTIYVLGNQNALSNKVQASLTALNATYTIKRLGGADRYATAVEIAGEIRSMGNTGPIYLASGIDFPDGLTVSSLAAQTHGVVLLTAGAKMPATTAAYLAADSTTNTDTVPVGGPAAAAYPSAAARAIVGASRYDTARLIAAQFTGQEVTTVGLATGANWPDALAGAAAMGIVGGPLVLSDPTALSSEAAAAVTAIRAKTTLQNGWIFGGTKTLSTGISQQFGALVTG